MPNINESTSDKIVNKGVDLMDQATMSAATTQVPVITCGVNRRINLGNYEHLDIFSGLALPLDTEMTEDLLSKITDKIAEGMTIVSRETNERFQMITEAQSNGRG